VKKKKRLFCLQRDFDPGTSRAHRPLRPAYENGTSVKKEVWGEFTKKIYASVKKRFFDD